MFSRGQARLAELSAVSDDALGQADEAKQQAPAVDGHGHHCHHLRFHRRMILPTHCSDDVSDSMDDLDGFEK